MIEVKIPTVGESITEVTIGRWTKNDGDKVSKNEIICELESDKASFELPSEVDGVLRIKVQAGQTVAVGATIAIIEPSAVATEFQPSVAAVSQASPQPSSVVKFMTVPTVGESITEVTLGRWTKNDGDVVSKDEVICELESDKASFELGAETTGILRIVAPAGSTVPIGGLLCKIEETQASAGVVSAPTPLPSSNQTTQSTVAGHPSPAAAKILAEKGIANSMVQGSGVGGRITKEDALKAQPSVSQVAVSLSQQQTLPTDEKPSRRQKMTNLRKTIAKRLVAVKNETAMLTTFNEIDMKAVMDLRSKYKDTFKEKFGIGLGFMSFFTKAVCVALQEWPAVNAYIDGDEIVYNDFCDISVAVSTPRGLVTPVVREAHKMSLDQIEKEIAALALKARDNKLSIPEMTGGTFTITNGGVFGSMMSTPILNPPQSAILGMHNIVNRPVAIGNSVEVRPIMYVALSYDHRIIDGRESVSFLVRVKQLIEDPSRLLLAV